MVKDGDFIEPTRSGEHDPVVDEISIARQLIEERKGALDILRELISNAAAKEVKASEIIITYHKDMRGHVFTIKDNGIGMDYRKDHSNPGRLDRFLGLGLSEISGYSSDEFGYKGIGSKLSYHSRAFEINTYQEGGEVLEVSCNEPWSTIERGLKPKPRVSSFAPDSGDTCGTTVVVIGHPPHSESPPYTFEEIKTFLRHRTFVGFTRERDNRPKIFLDVMGTTEEIPFGFPELAMIAGDVDEKTRVLDKSATQNFNGKNSGVRIRIKGFYTWDDKKYGLSNINLNTGMILSVKGIPYFSLDMKEYGSRSLAYAKPGAGKCCIIVECDDVWPAMNISRSDLKDTSVTNLFRATVKEMIEEIESSQEFLSFRRIPEDEKKLQDAVKLTDRTKKLATSNQRYVLFNPRNTGKAKILGVEPSNEGDVLNILWKLEGMDALPFHMFDTLHYSDKGPDLVVNFAEDPASAPDLFCIIEAERVFTNYSAHGHHPPTFPRVICWDVGKAKKGVRIESTYKAYKKTATVGDVKVDIYLLRYIEGVEVKTKQELEEMGLF